MTGRASNNGAVIHAATPQRLTLSEETARRPERSSTADEHPPFTRRPDITFEPGYRARAIAELVHVAGPDRAEVVVAAIEASILDGLAGHLSPRAAAALDYGTRLRYLDDALGRAMRCPVCVVGSAGDGHV